MREAGPSAELQHLRFTDYKATQRRWRQKLAVESDSWNKGAIADSMANTETQDDVRESREHATMAGPYRVAVRCAHAEAHTQDAIVFGPGNRANRVQEACRHTQAMPAFWRFSDRPPYCRAGLIDE